MKETWSSLGDLLTSTDFLVGLAIALIILVVERLAGLTARLATLWREWRFASYAESIGFEKEEVLASVETYVRQYGVASDPCSSMDFSESELGPKRSLFRIVDEFVMAAGQSRHLFLFADCGMGKTSFLINYFHRRRLRFKLKRLNLVLVSLSNASSFKIAEDISFEDRARTILLLDALDEDPLVLNGIASRVASLMSSTVGFRRVLITCRSQFFESDEHIPVGTGMLRSGPTKAGASKEYQFQRTYIAPFDKRQIKKYLTMEFPGILALGRRKRAKKLVEKIPNLALRPMLLAHISDILEQEGVSESMSLAQVYQALVSAWLQRERFWVDEQELHLFSRKLAANLYENRHVREGEVCERADVLRLAAEWGVDIRLEYLTGRSLLNRMADGRCKFAHRSILEFLVVEDVLRSQSGRLIELTGQMSKFLLERVGIRRDLALVRTNRSCRVLSVMPEERVGYPTNFNIGHEDSLEIQPGAIYNLRVETAGAGAQSLLLGEHIQTMLDELRPGKDFVDARVCVQIPTDSAVASVYLSLWSKEFVALSVLSASAADWNSITHNVLGNRPALNLVGRMSRIGHRAFELRWNAVTRCDIDEGVEDFDSAAGCQVLSVSREEGGDIELMVITSFVDAVGPLAPFGILRGGSMQLLRGRRSKVIGRPSTSLENVGHVVRQEEALRPASEKWPERHR